MFEWNSKERLDAIDRRLRHILMQNEAILAKLENRPSKLSPEDQKKLNMIFDTAAADSAKIDRALPGK